MKCGMRIRKIGFDWELAEVEHNEGNYVNVIFENHSNEQVAIMFWENGDKSKTFAFCSRPGDPSGVIAIDYDDLKEFIIFVRTIKTAENAIEYGKDFGVYHKINE